MSNIYRILLFLMIFLAVVTTGGVKDIFAQTSRFVYEVVAQNNTSKVTTVFQVYAPTERDANENVSANGWKVLSVKQLTIPKRQAAALEMALENAPSKVVIVESPLNKKKSTGYYVDTVDGKPNATGYPYPLGNYPSVNAGNDMNPEKILADILAKEPDEFEPYIETGEMSDKYKMALGLPLDKKIPTPVANLNEGMPLMAPSSSQLEYLYTVNFNLGLYEPAYTDAVKDYLSKLPKDGMYYLFGHTDNIAVDAGTEAYKDNFELSIKRADNVKTYLTQLGINSANINTIGLGSLYPAVHNIGNKGGTVQNRRVDIYGYKQKK